MRWLDYFPLVPLALAALLLGSAPPLAEPHLWQELKLIAAAKLEAPIDLFDFFLHASLPVLLALKLMRLHELRRGAAK
ncbi:MAG: RND transporter [Sulfurifustaceae bacterium]